MVCKKYCELENKDQFAVTKQLSIKPDEPLKYFISAESLLIDSQSG